ncbi:hypothetical protein [Flammeovirga aprica]|uniref:Uncharacterized protein n=1 Tax=Flammeovirga aprica JL-4 TaxID=694437 RepID=A0A7X9S228_9BACT|nr:hypothetical protein [Flammeovirga aprica]NME72963.1 hypothetical protein [Flammeovirga aprica JL-4]
MSNETEYLEIKLYSTEENVFYGEYINDNQSFYCQYYFSDCDTNIFYKKKPSGIKEFRRGKYVYQFNERQLSEGQRCFYLMNRDSLRKVRGDKLQFLPSVNCNELDYI